MRIKINLFCKPLTTIPIEYNYSIYLSIRKLVLDYVFAVKPKLHARYKKNFPDFTFSQLMIPERKIVDGFIEIAGTYLSFFISSMDHEFMEYVFRAFTKVESFTVHQKKLTLRKIEIVEEPEFKASMNFKMLSPLLLMKEENKTVRFIRPSDTDLSDVFALHLVGTYNWLFKTTFSYKDIRLIPDQSYLDNKKKCTRLLTIRNINYRTILMPIRLEGKEELIRFAYYNGIGDKTQYGLGMLDILK